VLLGHAHGITHIFGGNRSVAMAFEDLEGEATDHLVVFDNQHRLAAPFAAGG